LFWLRTRRNGSPRQVSGAALEHLEAVPLHAVLRPETPGIGEAGGASGGEADSAVLLDPSNSEGAAQDAAANCAASNEAPATSTWKASIRRSGTNCVCGCSPESSIVKEHVPSVSEGTTSP
jgi:hypothetical protein